MSKLLDQAESLHAHVLSSLTEMSKARASSSIEEYVGLLESFAAKEYVSFDKDFKTYYNSVVKPAMDSIAAMSPKEEPGKPGSIPVVPDLNLPAGKAPAGSPASSADEYMTVHESELLPDPSHEVSHAPTVLAPPPLPSQRRDTIVTGPPSGMSMPPSSSPATNRLSPTLPSGPPSVTPDGVNLVNPSFPKPAPLPSGVDHQLNLPGIGAHKKFYGLLKSMEGESPLLVSSFINKYANSIKSTDPETAIKLLGIAKQLRG